MVIVNRLNYAVFDAQTRSVDVCYVDRCMYHVWPDVL